MVNLISPERAWVITGLTLRVNLTLRFMTFFSNAYLRLDLISPCMAWQDRHLSTTAKSLGGGAFGIFICIHSTAEHVLVTGLRTARAQAGHPCTMVVYQFQERQPLINSTMHQCCVPTVSMLCCYPSKLVQFISRKYIESHEHQLVLRISISYID